LDVREYRAEGCKVMSVDQDMAGMIAMAMTPEHAQRIVDGLTLLEAQRQVSRPRAPLRLSIPTPPDPHQYCDCYTCRNERQQRMVPRG
jgi:hypothetical protein